ncbi:methyltransferase type 12 [Paenibacillus swuensis]|uniref:Methyltransferase type 12 n=1 Tax=Paenibacillus swuensis TaxID=1178515 RepID=A0A172TJR9_9BACL|nr:class I SAM-dependent methyltransferase [Paenibacillus swuensis]ANE47270.1 methyltransferase type 12 [Paenibacillus swuensis]
MSYGQFAYVYDRLMEDMPYPEWVEWAQTCWTRQLSDLLGHVEGQPHVNFSHSVIPKHVVDLGCGTGSVTIPLAKAGYRITGIDLSEDMLAVAGHKQLEQGIPSEQIRWLQQDMREWKLAEPVDAVISFCDCLNYLLEEEDVVSAFRQSYEGLKEGGMFLFDVHHPNQLRRYYESQPFMLNLEDVAYIWTCDYLEDLMQIEHELTIFAEEPGSSGLFRRVDEVHTQRAYALKWLELQLKEAGFREVRMYADFKFEAPTEESDRVFFVAVK